MLACIQLSLAEATLHGAGDRRRGVAQDVGAHPEHVVDDLVAIDVGQSRPLPAGVERRGLFVTVVAADPAGHDTDGPRVELLGSTHLTALAFHMRCRGWTS